MQLLGVQGFGDVAEVAVVYDCAGFAPVTCWGEPAVGSPSGSCGVHVWTVGL